MNFVEKCLLDLVVWLKRLTSLTILLGFFVQEPLKDLSNPGASGSLFFLTDDDEFIIKTVDHKEAKFLQKLLPGLVKFYAN